jgi:hypothetical protein
MSATHLAKPRGGRCLLVVVGSVWCLLLPLGLRDHVRWSYRGSGSGVALEVSGVSKMSFLHVDGSAWSMLDDRAPSSPWSLLFRELRILRTRSQAYRSSSSAPSQGRSGSES